MTNPDKPQTKRISAYGIITDSRSRLLLCRLSPMVEDFAGRWTLPGGGLDFGEDPATAVVREIAEETGLKARVEKLLDIDTTVLEFSDKLVHAIRIIYQVSVDPGDLKVEQSGSTDACDWFEREHLKHLPKISLTEKALKLLGWTEDGEDQRVQHDLSLTGLMRYFEDKGDPRSLMVVDYLKEVLDISDLQHKNARRRLQEMRKYS